MKWLPQIRTSGGNPFAQTCAFDGLWDEFAPRVRAYLFHLTGDRAEADDLTQETFLAAFQGRETYKGDAQPLAWLLGIARLRWRDGRRTPTLVTATLNEEALSVRDLAAPVAEAVALRAALTDALNRLSEAERDVMLLTAVQRLTYKEAAAILEQPVGTIKWRVFEATRKLRELLSADEAATDATDTLPHTHTTETPHATPDPRTERRLPRTARASRSR